MFFNRYEVTGATEDGESFYGNCIAHNISMANQFFLDKHFKVDSVRFCEQVGEDVNVGIEELEHYKYDRYAIYKSIMKRQSGAMDKIHTLEEAKDIIDMITGNVYLNGEIYQKEWEQTKKFLNGDKETINKKIEKFTANREGNIKPDEDIESMHH